MLDDDQSAIKHRRVLPRSVLLEEMKLSKELRSGTGRVYCRLSQVWLWSVEL